MGESDIDLLRELAKTQELYCFAEDAIVKAALSGLPYHAISVIHSFYANSNIQKTLVLSSRQSCDLVLSQDPAAFIHQIICDHAVHYSLAADLYGYEVLAINRALRVLHELPVEPGALINSAMARKALKTGSSSYSFFADHYDNYMAHVDYDLWITNIMFWQKEYARSQGKKALELACGTANIGSRLVVEGYEVDACDLSPQMLLGASKKAVKPSLYQASLTDPIPGRDYRSHLCLFDSINYLLSSADIRICFNQVSKALKPGGIFIFDISTLLNSMENFADNCSFSQSGDFFHGA
ncbi:MAG: class I SAM-dependent methyltransferase [Candidatus Cloacimonetes bacterium]|nr:class I SAM-dependent methyltransferase [Candidatus Cloacimonadota bacterium]